MQDLSKVLDRETQLLISTGAAVAAGCIPCLENIVGMAREQGIDEKKLRAAARTGQFIKEQPANLMKTYSDELLGTHLQSSAAASTGGCCPLAEDEGEKLTSASAPGGTARTAGGCGCA